MGGNISVDYSALATILSVSTQPKVTAARGSEAAKRSGLMPGNTYNERFLQNISRGGVRMGATLDTRQEILTFSLF